jgi:prolipoprotein diacylglyceryltransferase
VQLYNALTGFVILVGLLFVKHIPWPGFRFWLFVILYGTGRLLLEIFVARPEIIADGYLSTQIYSLLAIIVGLAIMAYNFSKDKTHRNPDTV